MPDLNLTALPGMLPAPTTLREEAWRDAVSMAFLGVRV